MGWLSIAYYYKPCCSQIVWTYIFVYLCKQILEVEPYAKKNMYIVHFDRWSQIALNNNWR